MSEIHNIEIWLTIEISSILIQSNSPVFFSLFLFLLCIGIHTYIGVSVSTTLKLLLIWFDDVVKDENLEFIGRVIIERKMSMSLSLANKYLTKWTRSYPNFVVLVDLWTYSKFILCPSVFMSIRMRMCKKVLNIMRDAREALLPNQPVRTGGT